MLVIHLGSKDYRAPAAKVTVPGIREPVGIRLETTDVPTFVQVFERKEYEAVLPLAPRFIVDGGANVGYTSIWFANAFPDAKIVAVEPDPANFLALRENVLAYPSIEPLQAAIWGHDARLRLVKHDPKGRSLGEWGVQVAEAGESAAESVAAVTIDRVLEDAGEEVIDILKLDVEGAEYEIFSGDYERWLPRTNVIMIELHDWLRDGCSRAVLSILKPAEFALTQRGQTLTFIRHRLVGRPPAASV